MQIRVLGLCFGVCVLWACSGYCTFADRVTTEKRNEASLNLDLMSCEEIFDCMASENQKVCKAFEAAKPQLMPVIEKVVEAFKNGGRLIYVGAGTSGRLGILDASECPPTFSVEPGMVCGIIAGGDKAIRTSVEGAEDNEQGAVSDLTSLNLKKDEVVVGISTNGSALYVNGAFKFAKEKGCKTALITCNKPANNDPSIDFYVVAEVGPEILTGSTRLKGGTVTKLLLNAITTIAMVRIGKVFQNLMVDVKICNKKLEKRAKGIISSLTGVSEEQAAQLLIKAHNNVKAALVMGFKQVDYETAVALLAQAGGYLRTVIAPPAAK